MEAPLLHLQNLTVAFARVGGTPVTVLHDIDITIPRGSITALVGESGSGKSVIAHSILQLLPDAAQIFSGNIRFTEHPNLLALSPDALRKIRGKRISMIFQEPMTSLNPLHTLGAQLREAIILHRPTLGEKKIRAEIHSLLDSVELSALKERLHAYPHELSGGQRQRVMIAMALANQPELLIADEPTTALDVTVQVTVLALLRKLQKERQMAILLITHDLTLVQHVADHVVVMKEGRVVEANETKKIFAKPNQDYTRQLLAAIPDARPALLPKKHGTVLKAEQISVQFPKAKSWWGGVKTWHRAVQNINVQIPAGGSVGVVGESGSGKTTLALALLKLLPATGTVVYLGQALPSTEKQMRPLRQHLQFVFQDPFSSLNPRMTIRQILAEGLRAHRLPETEKIFASALRDVGLQKDMLERYPHEFSGGQRQRISIARALILQPKVMILDEPTSALDVTTQGSIIALLKRLQQLHGISYLFISHDLRVIRSLCHHIIVMKNGKMVEEASNETLFLHPKHPYTQALLSASFLAA